MLSNRSLVVSFIIVILAIIGVIFLYRNRSRFASQAHQPICRFVVDEPGDFNEITGEKVPAKTHVECTLPSKFVPTDDGGQQSGGEGGQGGSEGPGGGSSDGGESP